MPEAFICDYVRTPIGRFGGALAAVRTDDLAAVPLKALVARHPGVDWQAVDDLIYAYCRGETNLAANGAYAQYVALPASSCGRAPRDTAPERVAVLPVAVLTATQVIAAAAPRRGEVALVIGANGAVGRQVLAGLVRSGVSTVAAARARHHAELVEAGAEGVVDPFELAEPADVVLDCGAGFDVATAARLLRPGGRYVSIVRPPDAVEAERAGIEAAHVFSRPDGARLTAIAVMIEQGSVPVPTAVEVVDLHDAGIAQEKLKAGHARRIALRLTT